MTIEYRPTLEWFTSQMDYKLSLPKNLAKTHWLDCDRYDLYEMLLVELSELEESMEFDRREDAVKECADIANFAMMIADWHRNRIEIDRIHKDC